MNRRLALLAAFLLPHLALADGLPLKDGRYAGAVVEFELTSEQVAVIERYRTCQLEEFKTMNVYTPYVFLLTPTQSRQLRYRVGFSPSRFEVYETYRGFNDAGPHWNLALRYSETKIEIPLDLLLRDRKAAQAHKSQGWQQANPCFPDLQSK